jgi:undecaprenyl-diphosphatase
VSHLSYLEAIVMGAVQGITELFPISSLGHAIIIPALIGGQWAKDLNVSAPGSPYLAFIVGLHVATALALLLFFWRDWVSIFRGFVSSIRFRRIQNPAERLAWLLILATIPVVIAGLLLEHIFTTTLGQPLPAAAFLAVNGLILLIGERLRSRTVARAGDTELAAAASANADFDADDTVDDERISGMRFGRGVLVGSSQILALAAGISRSGVAMVSGMATGLSHREAARFSFLLATPVILAAGVFKIPVLFGPIGHGIGGQVLAGSVAAFVAALISVGFLDRYFRTRTLTPFAIYCLVVGIGSFIYLTIR